MKLKHSHHYTRHLLMLDLAQPHWYSATFFIKNQPHRCTSIKTCPHLSSGLRGFIRSWLSFRGRGTSCWWLVDRAFLLFAIVLFSRSYCSILLRITFPSSSDCLANNLYAIFWLPIAIISSFLGEETFTFCELGSQIGPFELALALRTLLPALKCATICRVVFRFPALFILLEQADES
jgi:hypothetical protein